MKPVYLICGVPGSGKTWVCEQLMDKFAYVPHDMFLKTHSGVVIYTASASPKPVITECPFGERLLREELEAVGCHVIPYFIIEKPEVIKARYEKRENRPLPKASHTRAASIIDRALEWKAPWGTSEQILTKLKELPL